MFCPECGTRITIEKAKFCHNCGFNLSKVTQSEPPEHPKLVENETLNPDKIPTPPRSPKSTQSDKGANASQVNKTLDEGYFCTDCGADVGIDDKVCAKCGANLEDEEILESQQPLL